jgi:hypothetical protein
MELEQLKQQWDILHAKLDEEQIINKKLMENAIRQKIDNTNFRNVFGLAVRVIIIPFLFIMYNHKFLNDFTFYITITFLIFALPFSIYWTYQFIQHMSLEKNIIEVEKFLLKYKRYNYIIEKFSYTVIFIILSWELINRYEILTSVNMFYPILIIFSLIFIGIIYLGIYEKKKIKNLHQSISDLKEFEKE